MNPKKTLSLKQVEKAAADNMTMTGIAAALGISRDTLYERLKDQPGLQEAIQKGKSKTIKEVTSAIIDQARKGDKTMAIFFARTQCGWGNSDPLKVAGEVLQGFCDYVMSRDPKVADRMIAYLEGYGQEVDLRYG